jgi:hypothetical protein
MADPWIKLRKSLRTDPRVMALCAKLGKSKAEIIGGLCLLWFMADEHGEKLSGVTRALLSAEICVAGLAENLPECWLADTQDGLVFPNYEAHNGSTGKARALSSKRVERFRSGVSVTKALPEERRGEDIKTTTLPANAGESDKKFKYPDDFEEFWSHVPSDKKTGKGAAFKVWKRMSADDRFKATDRMEWTRGCFEALDPDKQRLCFLKDPQGWLNGRKFEDSDEAVKLLARGK